MDRVPEGCLICHEELEHRTGPVMATCTMCGRAVETTIICRKGHFVCDTCHTSEGRDTIRSVCLSTDSTDPIGIAIQCMTLPEVHMHGPEHHILVGSAIIAAYHNAGVSFDLPLALDEMARRGSQVPGGVCGNWGCCGAAVSAGIAASILTGTTPLSGREWGVCNSLTGSCLRVIGGMDGPRCCKRDSFFAITTACMYLEGVTGISLDYEVPTCTFHGRNAQCIGSRCPFNPDNVER